MTPVKILNGLELAGFIKERQSREVRSLSVTPKLAIIQCIDDPVINTYVRLKQEYGADLKIEVNVYRIKQSDAIETINKLNTDDSVHGIIIQLPLEDPQQTEELVNLVDPAKDVDALGKNAVFDPATPMAIMWLLSGYNVDLRGKKVLLIGRGKLVGAPLEQILLKQDIDVSVADRDVEDLQAATLEADVIITATGSPAILYPNMIKEKAVVVDAGVASEEGKTVGDLHESVYEREDLTITPKKGGVGPLTVCALFDNVIRAAS